MTEDTIWDFATPPSHSDPNSKEAAASVLLVAGTLRHLVADYLEQEGPLAEWEIEQGLHMSGNTLRPRIVELSRAGLVQRLDEPGLTPSGRHCALYRVTDLGRRVLEETR